MADPPAPDGLTRPKNPLHEQYLADPFAFRHGDRWYILGTGPHDGLDPEFPVLVSDDFLHWEPERCLLRRPDVDGDCFWAPEVAFQNGVFYLYYSVGIGDKGHQLRVATSSRPLGPYLDSGVPLLDDPNCSFAIDPHPFLDGDGQWYLFYARDFLDTIGGRAGTALAVAPLQDMTRIAREYAVVARARHEWQRFLADRLMYDGVYDWHTLEGPCVVPHDGRYYCFYSGGNWQNVSYGIDWMVADHPLGPWREVGAPDAPRVLHSVPGHVIGPGHNSAIEGPDGRIYLVYHAWDPAMTARRACIDPLVWTPSGPRCEGPSYG
ncbi:MAG TPA: glycoside hydrolase family 43 protein [Fimbriimonadaceae bacterium]|nr:glycoside hydrolase family 43 protein [Fimbriimonadaceae bacterium]